MDSMESKQFFLKWNNFENNLATGFASLLEQEAMVDVTLAAEGKIIQAHKIILSICSSYFRNIFQINPCSHPVVVLKDVGYQELIDMLDFMYKGEANVKQENLPSFLKLAETLKVKGLAGGSSSESNCNETSSSSELLNLTKNLVSNKVNWSQDIKEDISFRKKRKRPSSPYENLDSKSIISSQNVKLEDKKSENNFIITNSENEVTIKEERLSENGSELQEDNNFLVEDEQNSGPSAFNNFETASPDMWNPRRTSKPLSIIWSFFNFDCLENKSECKLCGKIFKASPKTGTASVKYHLHFAHQILRNDAGHQ